MFEEDAFLKMVSYMSVISVIILKKKGYATFKVLGATIWTNVLTIVKVNSSQE